MQPKEEKNHIPQNKTNNNQGLSFFFIKHLKRISQSKNHLTSGPTRAKIVHYRSPKCIWAVWIGHCFDRSDMASKIYRR